MAEAREARTGTAAPLTSPGLRSSLNCHRDSPNGEFFIHIRTQTYILMELGIFLVNTLVFL